MIITLITTCFNRNFMSQHLAWLEYSSDSPELYSKSNIYGYDPQFFYFRKSCFSIFVHILQNYNCTTADEKIKRSLDGLMLVRQKLMFSKSQNMFINYKIKIKLLSVILHLREEEMPIRCLRIFQSMNQKIFKGVLALITYHSKS